MRRSIVALALALVLPLPVLAGQVTIKEGETLSEIADRYGLSVNQLMKLNGLQNADRVEAGQTISVPGGSGGRSWSRGSGGSGGSASGRVTVRNGETLSEIADRYGVSVNQLMRLNGLQNADRVEAGQTISVPGGSSGRSWSRGSGGSGGSASGRVTVRDGDTLSEIADRYGMSVNQLMKLNGLGDADHLEAGQTLLVNRPSKPPSSGSGFRKGASEHVVRSGESLSVIADGYGIGVNKLIAINGISDPDHVEAGTRLKLKTNPPPIKPASPKAAARKPALATPVNHPQAAKPVAPKPRPVASVTQPVSATAASTQARAASTKAPVASAPAPAASTRTPAAATPAPAASTPAPAAATPAPVATKPAQAAVVAEVQSQPSSEKPIPSTRTITSASAVTTTNSRPTTAASVETAKPVDNPLIATASPTSRPAISSRQASAPRAASSTNTNTRPIRPVVTRATVTSQPVVTVATAPRAATTATSGRPDWRTYGPLQVDWTGWQPMGGSMVAPTLNAQGQSLYLAINCGARKLNATTQAGDWKTWDDPRSDFELQLVNDYCRSRS